LQAVGTGDHNIIDKEFDVLSYMAFFGAEALPDSWMQVMQGSKKLLYSVGSQHNLALASTIGT
jgi:hypothetical protein